MNALDLEGGGYLEGLALAPENKFSGCTFVGPSSWSQIDLLALGDGNNLYGGYCSLMNAMAATRIFAFGGAASTLAYQQQWRALPKHWAHDLLIRVQGWDD